MDEETIRILHGQIRDDLRKLQHQLDMATTKDKQALAMDMEHALYLQEAALNIDYHNSQGAEDATSSIAFLIHLLANNKLHEVIAKYT